MQCIQKRELTSLSRLMSEATNQRWTRGDYHKRDFGDFSTIQWPSTIGTTDPVSGFVASERPSLHESWDLG